MEHTNNTDFHEVFIDPDSDVDYDSDGDVQLTQDEIEDQSSETDFEEDNEIQTTPTSLQTESHFRKNAPFASVTSTFEKPASFVSSEFGNGNEDLFGVLRLLLTDEIVVKICFETNEYAKTIKLASPSALPSWKPLELEEFWQFIAVNICMGIVKKPALKDYWCQDPLLHTPFFSTVMSRNRYMDILRSLHFVDNAAADKTDRYYKLGSFMPDLLKNFKSAVNLGEYFTIDESLLPFQGRLSFKQFNPMKRARFGIKHFALCDSETSFVYNILPYQGKSTQIANQNWIHEYGFGGAAVLSLMQNSVGKGHRLTIDNWFMSPKLAAKLLSLQTYVLGTVQVRRKGMPKFTPPKLKLGEIQTYSNGTTLIERWMDRRQVVMLNTFMQHRMETVACKNPANSRPKPISVIKYNSTMGALDNVDRTIRTYQSVRKSLKWYKKVAFTLIDTAIFNSNIIYTHWNCQELRKPYKEVLLGLIRRILDVFPVNKPKRGRPASHNVSNMRRSREQHLPEKTMRKGRPYYLDCVYCTGIGLRHSTAFQCSTCNKRLCIHKDRNCFQLYHSVDKLPFKKRPRIEQPRSTFFARDESNDTAISWNSTSFALEQSNNTVTSGNSISLLAPEIDEDSLENCSTSDQLADLSSGLSELNEEWLLNQRRLES